MYRPLNQNEYAIVSKTIYDERGLDGGLADSMFMAYKARAMALDEPEYVIFQESEFERKARLTEKQKEKVTELKTSAELAPMDFLRKLEAITSSDEPPKEPENPYEWFYGDESLLDARFKRLRFKFFNSLTYRKIVLCHYTDRGILSDVQLKDTELIGKIIGEYHRKYPGTRQGIISYYERLFGDASGFCYDMAMEREKFFTDIGFRKELLKKLQLPEDMSIDAVREDLKKSAIESGVLTLEEINCWEEK
jgi:hypothetical protein